MILNACELLETGGMLSFFLKLRRGSREILNIRRNARECSKNNTESSPILENKMELSPIFKNMHESISICLKIRCNARVVVKERHGIPKFQKI